MRNGKASLFAIVALIVAALAAEPAQHVLAATGASDSSGCEAIEGVWRMKMDGLPAITLNITYESGSLNGAILFYLLRKDPGQPETSSPGIPEPLLNPTFDGVTLTFAVSHRRAHPPATLSDPPARFRLRITAPGRGRLVNELQPDAGPEMVRDSD